MFAKLEVAHIISVSVEGLWYVCEQATSDMIFRGRDEKGSELPGDGM